MAKLTREQLVERAEALGHSKLRVYQTKSGRRYACECACGWGAADSLGRPTVTRATQLEAVRSLQHHLWSALDREYRERVANGVSVDALSGGSGRNSHGG
jgi:hypothetical protein